MGRSATWNVQTRTIANQGELRFILMRLMLSVNDLAVCNHTLIEWQESADPKKVSRKNGGGMYFVRLIMSHVHEALRIVRAISQAARLRDAVYRCDRITIAAVRRGGAHQPSENIVHRRPSPRSSSFHIQVKS
jgi:hypothetical protein